ncbi:MAG: sodium:solute symporter [Betaproteobacteria bacterium]|nr:MAG: sodium:solute symporter [Betaproteobacteria bacterium]
MLTLFICLYLIASIAIGLYVARQVHTTRDFAIAGRHLPLPVVTATVFATWFGAEAVFGISATFIQSGLSGIVADPFGSSMCLVLAGIFFASVLYKLNILTLGDYFRLRYNRTVEVLTTLCIVAAYLGWVAAQIKAMGLLFNLITNGAVSEEMGMILGAAIVLTYTTLGGMLSVAILDFVQMGIIIVGMLFIAWLVSLETGGVAPVIEHARAAGKLAFFPPPDPWLWITFLGAWVTMMLGSIPQQDVFQRITSAKSANIALWGSILGATIYFCFAFVPVFIAYSATIIDPVYFNALLAHDAQRVLPTLVLERMPLFAQVVFFGAVLSAIMSCASATLLAPSVAFSENILKGFYPHLSDRRLLHLMRVTLVGFTGVVLLFALNTETSIFKMVENAYKVTLAGAFVPLVFGAFWRRANNQGALAAIILGLTSWILIEVVVGEASLVPPQLIGLFMSLAGMIAGSLLTGGADPHRGHRAVHGHAHPAKHPPAHTPQRA